MRYFTKELASGVLSINAVDGVQIISIQANLTSSCTIAGNFPFQGNPSTAITLSNGEGLTISANVPSSPIDGVTITWVSGTIDVVLGF